MTRAFVRHFALLAAMLFFAQAAAAQGKKATGPKLEGETIKFTFDGSKIFPGTLRNVTVYVPKQYDGSKPACVYVNQDGVQYNAPLVFDDLIAKKEMPITIGVFVTPGVVKAPAKSALDRFNRSFEYDGLGDAYARFLLEELLPAVETKKTADGRAINLSKSGNDRAIAGNSSGAICAFTAAWERPDAFGRVFSSIGTFVGLRGGDIYPTLIRKTEPKPIRVFLQDGSADLNIYGGDWWMANQTMERALTFAGYEVNHVWGKGGHSAQQATEIFPEAMRWLWKDHPSPIKAGLGSQQMKDILIPGEGWKLVSEGHTFTEGPCVDAAGVVYFNDIPKSKTFRIGLDGKVVELPGESKKANGMAFGPDGRRYVIATETEQVLAIAPDGKTTVLADGFRGNDLCVGKNGDVYVTNPPKAGSTDPSLVWRISPKGEKMIVDKGLKFANGVIHSPDQSLLYVNDMRSHWVYSYQIQPDGALANKQKYYHLHMPDTADDSGADGMKVDRDGRLYVATHLGVQVCDQAGRVNCIIPTPNRRCANLTLGGPEFDTIYATCGDKVYSRRVKTRGANGFAGPVKPKSPQL
jgi:gluconolactonase